MVNKIILASKSKVRKDILDNNNILNDVKPSNIDEDVVKKSLIKEKATPEIISKNLAELKANKISLNEPDQLVLGADSVIDLEGELISKPENREEALLILKKLNGKIHYLISSACISKNGAMIWNHSDQSELKMKNFKEEEFVEYLNKIKTDTLLRYGVYQIEANGLNLFEYIKGDKDSIMGLPIKQIMDYIKQYKK